MSEVTSVNGMTGAVVLNAADVGAVASSSEGEPNGVATLNSSGQLPETQLPTSVVSSSAPGFAPSVIWLDTTPEFYGAKRDGVTDDTAAWQACSKAIKAKGGGVMRLSAGTYIVDGYEWESGVFIVGRGGTSFATKVKPVAGSGKGAMITCAAGPIIGGGFEGICFLPQVSNVGQDCMRFVARGAGAETKGGVWNGLFKDVQIGVVNGAAWTGNCMWFQGGSSTNLLPHQYNRFENCCLVHENEGAVTEVASGQLIGPKTSRCIKLTGQCEKFEFDNRCVVDGQKNLTPGVGTLAEISREFTFSTTLEADGAAGVSKITVKSTAGLEPNKRFSIGEGAYNELCQVEGIVGKEVALKKPLEYAHAAADTNLYVLSGTVGAPATFGSSEIVFSSGTYQNCDAIALIDTATIVDFYATDQENVVHHIKVRNESFQINLHGVHPNSASQGVSNGTGTITVGSNIITAATGLWVNGDTINGRGIPTGTTVTVEGATLTLSKAVEVNGTEGPIASVPLTKGGEGSGYIARYEAGCQGEVSYYGTGPIDNGVVSVEASVRVAKLARKSSLPVGLSTGVTLAKGTASVLDALGVRELVLTNATSPIRVIQGSHGPGEKLHIRATVSGTKFEQNKVTGTNLLLPGGSLTLEANEIVTFLRTDNGNATWVLVGVQRIHEEYEWQEVEELNANLESSAGWPPHLQWAVRRGQITLRGVQNVKTEIAISSVLCKLPAAARPETKRLLVLPNTEKYILVIIEPSGNVVTQSLLKTGTKIGLDGLMFPLKP